MEKIERSTESQKLNEFSKDHEDEEKVSFIKRIFGPDLDFSGLSFREKIQKILESKKCITSIFFICFILIKKATSFI